PPRIGAAVGSNVGERRAAHVIDKSEPTTDEPSSPAVVHDRAHHVVELGEMRKAPRRQSTQRSERAGPSRYRLEAAAEIDRAAVDGDPRNFAGRRPSLERERRNLAAVHSSPLLLARFSASCDNRQTKHKDDQRRAHQDPNPIRLRLGDCWDVDIISASAVGLEDTNGCPPALGPGWGSSTRGPVASAVDPGALYGLSHLVRLFTRRRSRGPRLGRPYKSSLQSVGRTEHCANRELRLAAPAISLR